MKISLESLLAKMGEADIFVLHKSQRAFEY